MAKKDDMNILITGYLDETKTTNIINQQLRKIEKKLKLNIGIDNKQLAGLVKDIEKIQNKLKGTKVSPISDKDTKQVKVFYDSMEKAVEKYSKLGQVKVDSKINPATKDIERFTLAVTKANGEIEKLHFAQSKLKDSPGKYALTGQSNSNNTASIRERQLQQEQNINREIDKQNQKLKHQLEMYKQEANLKARNLINANKNNKNFDDTAVKGWLNQVNALNTSTPMATQQMDRLRMQFRNIQSEASNTTGQVSRFGSTMENAFGRMPIYMAASAALFAPFAALNSLIDTLYVLDERLVTIDKVSENADLASIFDKGAEAAYKYGQAIDSALESYGEISKLGFGNADAQVLNNGAMLLDTVGEYKSNTEAANYLVAIIRQYKLEVEDAIKVVDALNEVSNKTGADTVGLSQGLSKASSSAATAGVNFHELNGMIATTQETLKVTGNVAGTFYKTLFSRFLRDRTQNALEAIGIQTKDMNGELRSATDVLRDLGSVWSTLDSQTQNSIASELGGGWHISKTISLLENQDRVLRNTEVSMNSYGSATEELGTFQEGLRFKTNTMIAAFQELAMTVGENGARDGIVKILESVTALTQGFTQVTEATDGWNIKLPILIGLAYAGVKAFGALRVALTGVKSAMGIFGLGLIAVETIASMFMKSASAADLNTEAMTELAKKTSDQKDELQKLIETYNTLEPQAKNNADKQKELESVLSDIQTLAPHLIESTGKYGDALSLNKDKAADYIVSLKTMSKEQFKMAQSANAVEMSTINVDLDKEQNKLNKLEKSVKDSLNRMQEYQKKYDVSGLNDAEEEYNNRRIELAEKASKAIESGNKELSNKITLQLTEMLNEYAEYVKIIEDKGGKLADYNDQISEVQKLEGKKGEIEARKKALDDLIKSTDRSSSANKQNADSLNQLAGGVYESAEGMEGLADATSASADADLEKLSTAERLTSVSDDQIDSIYEMIGTYQLLSQVENLSVEQKSMLADATEYLAGVYPHLVSGSSANIEMMKREIESTDVLRQAIQKMADGEVSAQDEMTIAAAVGTKNRLNLLKKEIQALNEFFAQANDNANTLEAEKLAMRKLPTIQIDIDSLTKDMDSYTSSLSKSMDIHGRYSQSQIDAAKNTEKAAKEYSNSTYVSDRFKSSLEKINAELEKQNNIQEKTAKHSKQYQTSLKNEISLLDQKKKLLQEQYKSLDSQIKSGKIQQTGIVTTDSASVPVSTSNSYASGSSSAATIWNFFKSKGFSDSIVAGIMGNLKLESGLNPNAINKSSGATGIAQWLGGRKTNLSNFAKSSGTSMYDLNTQLNFLWKELNGSESRTMSYLQGAGNKSAAEVARMFDLLFERSEGTHIPQRQAYANQYLSQYAGTSVPVTSASSSTSDASKQVAENLQSIDQAKSDLLQLQTDALSVQGEIEQLQLELVKVPLYQAENRFKQIDSNMKIVEARMDKQLETSKAYRKELDNQVIFLKEKKKLTEQNMVYIEKELKNNKNLTQLQKDELQQTYLELRDTLVDLDNNIVQNRNSFLNSALDGLNERFDQINQKYIDQISVIEHLMDVSTNNEQEQVRLQGEKLSALAQQRKSIESNIKALESQDKNLKSNLEALRKNKEETKKWKDALMSVEQQIQSIYTELADKVIDAQKSFYQEKMNAELDQLEQRNKAIVDSYDKERKLMEENHKKAIKLIEDELEAYQDAVNARLRAIDDLESERDYNKELEGLSKDKLKLEAEYNKLALDNSFEAGAKKAEIAEQLREKEEQIAELKHKREIQLRKESLQDELESKQEQLEKNKETLQEQQESERENLDQSHENLIDKLEDDKQAIRKHYENIINDERKWAKMREDIMKGNITNLSSELTGFSNDVSLNMSHMGDSIKNNLIDKLREALNLMKEVSSSNSGGFSTGISLPSSPSNGSGSSGSGNSNSGGSTKPSTPTMWNGLEFKSGQIGMLEVTKAINLWKRVNGKLVEDRILKPGEKYRVYGYDSAYGGQYDVGGGRWVTNMPSHIKYMTPSKDLLDRYHDGGIVGGKGNRLTEMANKLFNVGKGEQVIKSLQGELQIPPKNIPNVFKNISNLVSNLSPSASGGNTIINLGGIHVANMNGTQQDVDNLYSRINSKLKSRGVRT